MSENPVNLLVRFLLELAGLGALGYWGWTQHDGLMRLVWTIALVLGAAAIWAVFRVPGDGGEPVVAVGGRVRLLIEAIYFSGAALALAASEQTTAALIFGAIVVVHYVVSYDRVLRFIAG